MTMEADANGNGSRQVVRLISGFWITQAIYVAAKLGIADLLAEGLRATCPTGHASMQSFL